MQARKDLHKAASKQYAIKVLRFFKVEKGDYGYGDIFIGVRMPAIRALAKKHIGIKKSELNSLIQSKVHEERMLGLIILVNKYIKAKDEIEREQHYKHYVSKFKYINSWDLVDVTCAHIIGRHLLDKDRKVLYKWAKSKNLWTRRIAMVTNWWFIRNGDLKDVFKIAEILLHDDDNIIQRPVGWMIREAAKKDMKKAEAFLKKHYKKMPRIMLYYAVVRFPKKRKQAYLNGKV